MDYLQFIQILMSCMDDDLKVRKRKEFLDEIVAFDQYHTPFPTEIYVNDLYSRFLYGDYLEDIVNQTKVEIEEKRKEYEKMQKVYSGLLKNNGVIIFKLVKNTESYLKNVPHRIFFDMAVIYQFVIFSGQSLIMSSVIDKQMAEDMDITEEELYEQANENTKVVLKLDVKLEIIEGKQMVIPKTRSDKFGAVCLLYLDVIKKAAKLVNNDIYLWAFCEDDVCITEVTDVNYMVLSGIKNTGWSKTHKSSLSNTLLLYKRKEGFLRPVVNEPERI